MQGIAAIALGLLVVAALVVGVRLLALHRRTGAAPELLLGLMLLLSVVVAYPLMIASQTVGYGLAQVVSTCAIDAGFSLLFVFTWRVFRPEAAWARTLAAVGVLMLLSMAVRRTVQAINHGALLLPDEGLREALYNGGPVIAAYLWTACESFRYYVVMRRRERVGLADAATSNRFLLWALMSLAALAQIGTNMLAFARHIDAFRTPWVLLLSSATGLAHVTLLMLTFLPPHSYLRWLRARAAARGA